MKRSKFEVALNLWISLVINVVLCIALPLLAIGFINWGIFLKGFIIAFPLSTIFVFLVPIVKWGEHFAAALKAKPYTLASQLLSTLLLALVLGTLMSLLMTAVNAGVGPFFFKAWISAYPFVLIIVYISALIGIWTGLPLVRRIVAPPAFEK